MRPNALPTFLAFTLLLFATGCSQTQPKTPAEGAPHEMAFWQVKKCEVVGTSGNITLASKGDVERDKLYVTLVSDVPLQSTPYLTFNGAPVQNVALEGRDQNYSFELSVTQKILASLLHPDAYLVVNYTPNLSDASYKAAFPTRSFATAAMGMKEWCQK